MPRNRDSERYPAYDDEWDDAGADDDSAAWDDEAGYSRALAPFDESERYLALDDDDGNESEAQPRDVLIIPGEGLQPYHGLAPRRKRPLTMQLLVLVVSLCLVLSIAFSFIPLSDIPVSAAVNPFSALVNSVNLGAQKPFVSYRARSSDTFDTIAQVFGLQTVNGIYEANKLNVAAEVQVGTVYQIPTNPTYGVGYKIPLPAGFNLAGNEYPAQNVIQPGNTCLFCSVAGKDNGPGGICSSYGQTLATTTQAGADVTQYQLLNPDQPTSGSAKSHWVRGFYALHSGIDISTTQYGTPLYAAQTGTVIFAAFDSGGGGWSIKINHCGGLATSYSHLVSIPANMKVGTNVNKGEQIGLQGNSGNSFGSHLHYMLWWDNTPIDGLCAYTASNNLDGYQVSNDPQQRPPYGGCPPNLTPSAWLVGH